MTYITMIYCGHCKTMDKPLTLNAIGYFKEKVVRYCRCRDCNNKFQRKSYKKNPKRYAEYVYKSISRYPEKQEARKILAKAIRKGEIKKPKNCSHCKMIHSRLNAHHDDYTKPTIVTWLCPPCHKKLHSDRV